MVLYKKIPRTQSDKVSKSPRDRKLKEQRNRVLGQLRDNHPTAAAGAPDVTVLKTAHADEQTVGAHAHAGNEELIMRLKQKECRVAVSPEPIGILFHKVDYLVLCK